MKIHSGVDAENGYVHPITATATNTSDILEAHNLTREDDSVVYGDSGYLGLEKRNEIREDERLLEVECRICRRPSQSKITPKYEGENWDKIIEHQKSSVRCKVEHPFLIVKRQFGYCKAVYRGAEEEPREILCAVRERKPLDMPPRGKAGRVLRGIGGSLPIFGKTTPDNRKQREKREKNITYMLFCQ